MPGSWRSGGLEVVSERECRSLLETRSLGRLAVAVRNHPHIFPVNYLVDDRTIIFRTEPGMKLAAAIAGESVAFEVDESHPVTGDGWSVEVTGEAHEITELGDLLSVEELPLTPAAPGPKNRWVRIHPRSVSGRRVPARSPEQSTHSDRKTVPSHRSPSPRTSHPRDVGSSSPVPSAPLAESNALVWR